MRLSRGLAAFCLAGAGLVALAARAAEDPAALAIQPADVTLRGPLARQRVLVTARVDGRLVDRTRVAQLESLAPEVVRVDEGGVLRPLRDGAAAVRARVGSDEATIRVQVAGFDSPRPITLERDVLPLFTRLGCNAGACHGKARGQNGFQLSLFGFDPNFDHDALTKEARGRRVFPAAPEQSLLLLKPCARVPHGGGQRLEPGSEAYALLLDWIARGAPRDPAESPQVTRLTVDPAARTMAPRGEQQLIITAHLSDGSSEDVTHLAAFQSNESAIVAVDASGLVQAGPLPGEAAITARFRGQFATCEVTIPLPGAVPADLYEKLPRQNFIDDLVWQKLERLGITPSAPASDANYLRRAYIDVIGRLPTPEETRAFLADKRSDKRARLIDTLLERPEYADHWANKWVDLLRPNPYRVGIKAVLNLDAWIRDAFRQNMPFDQFARQVVTAQGSTFRDGAVTVFRDRREPEEAATMVSQLFLGIRLECARCHHHPFEVWSQDDFYGFAAYFARIGHKGTGLSPPISGSEEIFFAGKSGSVKHPLTGRVVEPKPLFGKAAGAAGDDEADPRIALARWMTAPDNPYLAQVTVNRVWADLMGRGLVEPVDDLRATNPPTNGPLLEALAKDFRAHNCDLKHLIRTITTSYVYALSSEPSERNVADTRNHSRHYRERLRAEVLLDAICDITQVPEKFAAAPPGTRAAAIWTHRTPSLFLDTFGRPDPNQDPPCQRVSDTSVVQALHLMNAPALADKLASDDGRVAHLAKTSKAADELVEELYLLVYCRLPSDDERALGRGVLEAAGANRRAALEDLLWALLNTPEFVFKD